eukprot:Nk52_evm5s2062 gene=Nk52_evmTU5s2062
MKKALTLNTSESMPLIGLGTWKAAPDVAGRAVYNAIKAGYRHIDCAENYGNEAEIGTFLQKAFNDGLVKREELFITGKLNNPYHRAEDVLPALKRTLKALQIEYIDLYLMHWPVAFPYVEPGKGDPDCSGLPREDGKVFCPPTVPVHITWKAMEELVGTSLVKSIGVANFTGPLLFDLLTYAKVVPAVNQIELHPYNSQKRLVEFCQRYGVMVTGYTPLGGDYRETGGLNLLVDETIVKLAKKYGKSPAQIILRWNISRDVVVIPKSSNENRICENLDVLDFELSPEDQLSVDALNKGHRFLDPYDWYGGGLFC